MQQGFDVFRSVAPHAPFDLAAYRDGRLLRVEVKTLGKPATPTIVPVFGWPTNDEWDILVVVGDQHIFQFPAEATRHEMCEAIATAYGIPWRGAPVGPTAIDVLCGHLRAIFRESPTVEWRAADLREELGRRGWTTTRARPVVAVSEGLGRLVAADEIRRVGPGRYIAKNGDAT